MRMLEKASPRVKVLLDRQDGRRPRDDRGRRSRRTRSWRSCEENRARLAKLGDPRTINMDDAQAETLVDGVDADLLHHRHDPLAGNRIADGADGARLSPRRSTTTSTSSRSATTSITLITPVIEVDGRDKMVDVYKWHLAHPGRTGRASSTGASTSRTTTTATRWASTLEADRERAQHLHAVAPAGAARPARVGAVSLRQHRSATARTTRGSIRSSPTSGR